MDMRKKKGISEAIGFIILIMLLLVSIIPVSIIMLLQPSNQFQEIQSAQTDRDIAMQQYNLFKPTKSAIPSVFFVYDKNNNSVEFIMSSNETPSTPLIIKYLMVFDGTNWIRLSIVKQGKTIIAVPANNNSSGIVISQANSNAVFGNYSAIKIQLTIRPYDNASNYIVAVTQYGNIIYPVQGVNLPTVTGYIYEGGTWDGMMQGAFPTIINYYPKGFYGNPILQLANVYWGEATDGLVIWKQKYIQGQELTIAIVGTYTQNWFDGGHGFNFYLFMQPSWWNVSSKWNSSEDFPVIINYYYYPRESGGMWALPQSKSPYIMVTWDAGWGTYYSPPPNGGMWDVWRVFNPNDENIHPLQGFYPSNYSFEYIYYQDAYDEGVNISYYGMGQGYFYPNPGDLIIIIVTYDPQTNMLYGIAYDYNTSQYSLLQFNLNVLGFKPPKSGYYVFAIGSGNAWLKADWSLLYTNVPLLQSLFSPIYAKCIQYVEAKMQGA